MGSIAQTEPPAPKPALTVTVTTPVKTTWNTSVLAMGTLNAWQEAVIATEISGQRIAEVLVAVIGLLMLMGIVTKNSILLVDYAVMAWHEQGLNRFEALMDACHKRVRPIVMTTMAMGAGMMPTALGLAADPSFRAPMAIVVIGGLIASTFLSLLVIPVVFTFIDDLLQLFMKLTRRNSLREQFR